MTQTHSGWALVGIALLIGGYQTLDRLAELRDYHGIWEPSVLAPMVKSFVGPAVSFLGGWMLNPPGGDRGAQSD